MAEVNPAQIQRYLGGMDYPTSKDELVSHAAEEGADDNVLSTLRNLPSESFNSPNDVSEALGQMNRSSK